MSLDERITDIATARHVKSVLEAQRQRNRGVKPDHAQTFGKTLIPAGILGFVLGSTTSIYYSLHANKDYQHSLAIALLSATMALIGAYLRK
ncbi:hypothetical protein HY493_00500 [Candidatus Woesearchaeota archaeon]|nr:hypothetical protein [Candidatus Woesearchaeota archaeon]